MFKSGDYVCVSVTGTGFTNKICDDAIHWFTKSPYAHAFIVTDAAKGEIVEATPHKGVGYANIDKYMPYKMVFSTTVLSDIQREKVIECAKAQVGNYSYGFLDIVYLGMYTQGHTWNWLESEVIEQKKSTICSQSVAICGNFAGVKEWLCGQPHPNLVWPGMLADLALSGADPKL